MDIVRTPDERFTDLPDFPWVPRYVETADGLRVAVVDEGPREGPTVLLMHGEPSWSFLYRKVIPVLLAAGYRVVAPDLVGFGRSDKPVEDAAYSYAAHVEWMRDALFDGLGLTEVVLYCQDWGGLIGLRLVAEHPERFTAVCAANTGLPDGSVAMGPEWQRFAAFVAATPDLPIGFLVSAGCAMPMPPEAVAAYDAPFPDVSSKAGARTFPLLIPQSPEDPATPAQLAAWEQLSRWDKPFLCAFSDSDPITRGGDRFFLDRVPGAAGQPHAQITGAAHFLQEDAGEQVGAGLVGWLAGLSKAQPG